MEAPAEKSPAPSAAAHARVRSRAGALRLRLSPQLSLLLALAVLTLSTYAAVRQSLHPDAYRQTSVFSREWWAYPFEWNPPARLPAIPRDLKDVYPVPNTTTVYAVGELGTVLVSTDDGQTWQKPAADAPAPAPQGTNAAQATPTPQPDQSPLADDERSVQIEVIDGRAEIWRGDRLLGVGACTLRGKVGERVNLSLRRNGVEQPVSFIITPNKKTYTFTFETRFASPTATPAPSPTPRIPSGQSGPASVEGKTLSAVHFTNYFIGFAVTDKGECIETLDGGVGWLYCYDKVGQDTAILGSDDRAADEVTVTTWAWSFVPGFGWYYNGEASPVRVRLHADAKMSRLVKLTSEAAKNGHLPNVEEVFFVNANEGWGLSGADGLFHTSDGGKTWGALATDLPSVSGLHSLYFTDPKRGWAAGAGDIVATTDGGHRWRLQTSRTGAGLKSVSFRDEQHGWAVGDAGTILHTEDGGATWVRQTRELRRGADGKLEGAAGVYYFRLLPPWYYLSWVVLAFLLLPVRRTALVDSEEEPEPSVADVLVSDRPLEEGDADTIDFKPIALGLSRFLRNENTKPPLTIAITGEWGTGKSSLMNLLRADLRRYDFRPVWFNAWHHQKEEHLLASLLQNVRLQAVPPLRSPGGMVFRLRLLRIRGARHWGPVALLVVFALVALFYWLISGGATNTYLAEGFKEFAALFNGGVAPKVDPSAKPYLAVLPLLVSLVTGGVTLWRGATAFGVNPASLMASMSRGVRVRDLDAQTSFRQRFASEFYDVTEALGARSMIIFIDDLDRCRPENVVETLEAVNFLVSSGGCFVVIGMARERVEPCVGLSFRDVAAEMLDEAETAAAHSEADENRGGRENSAQAQSAPKSSEADAKRIQEEGARRKRLEYARQYLDKLINIEVPVPVPTPDQSRGILVANARRAEEERADAPKPLRRRLLPAGAEALARDYGRLLAWCAGLVILLSLCYGLASFLARPVANAVNAPTPNATPTPAPTPAASPSQSARQATPTPIPTPTPAQTNANADLPELTSGKSSVLPSALPLAFVVLLVAWVCFWVLTRRPGLVVKDSPKFVDALAIWHPLVYARSTTPRSTKRFMNRVRYLAMRQRRQKDDPPAWSRLLRRFSRGAAAEAATEKEARDDGVATIPDELLVALAAIQHFKPDWLTNAEAFLTEPSKGEPTDAVLAGARCDKDDWALLQKAKEEHLIHFGEWGSDKLVNARDEFLRISIGVHVN